MGLERESSWRDCLECNSALKAFPNPGKAKSLIQMAQTRLAFLKTLDLNESSANFLFEGYYSSLVELLHALVILAGFKVNNHICLGFYLRDILNKPSLFAVFDDLRFKRNSSVYYGRLMDFAVAQDAIQKAGKLTNELLKLL